MLYSWVGLTSTHFTTCYLYLRARQNCPLHTEMESCNITNRPTRIVKISHHVFGIREGNVSICFSRFGEWCYEGTNPEETERTPPENTALRQAVSWYLTMFGCVINLSHLKVTLSRSRDHYNASTNHTTYLTAILESLQYKCHKWKKATNDKRRFYSALFNDTHKNCVALFSFIRESVSPITRRN